LLNHPKLKPDTQLKLKFLYRANEEINKLQAKQQLTEHKEAPIEVSMDQAYENHQYSKTLEISPPSSFNQYEISTSPGLNLEASKLYDVTMAQDYSEMALANTTQSSGG
jgi:hypothetical protein